MSNGKKRVQILPGKHRFVGRLMVEWALNPKSRPTTIEELRTAFDGLAELSPVLTKVGFIDTPMDTALFRLPPKEMVQASVDRVSDPNFTKTQYDLPTFYGVTADNLALEADQLFHARVGDYTTGECG